MLPRGRNCRCENDDVGHRQTLLPAREISIKSYAGTDRGLNPGPCR